MWKQQFIQTSRGTFELFVAGEGAPLCITHVYHEFNDEGNLFADLFTPHYQVYLINLRGCGHSVDDGMYTYGLYDSVKDLEAIRRALQIEQWGFAGHSSGGMLALEYALHAREAVSFIVAGGLCPSAAYMDNPASIYCKQHPHNARWLHVLEVIANPHSTLQQRREASMEWSLLLLHKAESYARMRTRPTSGKTVSKRLYYFMQHELPTFDLMFDLSSITTRAFIYSGLYDAQCPYEYAITTSALMPNATLTTFSNSNHFPFVEEQEAFTQFIETVVAQTAVLKGVVS